MKDYESRGIRYVVFGIITSALAGFGFWRLIYGQLKTFLIAYMIEAIVVSFAIIFLLIAFKISIIGKIEEKIKEQNAGLVIIYGYPLARALQIIIVKEGVDRPSYREEDSAESLRNGGARH